MTPILSWIRISAYVLVITVFARGQNPPPTQVFYVPFPEDNQLAGFSGINSAAVDPLAVFVTFSSATDGTVIYYDHWEDGYERDITNPTQATTLVFGDGNVANGYPPGNPSDMIPAGTVFSLRNYVTSTNLTALDYDSRDKVASYKPISLTKTTFPASTNTLLAGCVEVFERGLWGTEYRVPIGQDMPTSAATATLAEDYDIFSYTALSIMAGEEGATVQIDADNNGAFEQTLSLAEGETTYVTNVNTGGRVVSNNPVQVVLFSGRPSSNYQSRDTSLLPTYRWSNSYYAPVTTDNGGNYRTTVFLYNPSASAITVSYDFRNSASSYTTATVSVPAGGNARVNLSPAGTGHSGAYRFYTTGATPPSFYAFSSVDAGNTSTSQNQAFDGGFTLVGKPSLTTQVLVSLGIGRDPYSATSPTQNGNPVWITTVGNGHTAATIYVDYNGDNAGANTDPNGNHYDVSYSLRELEQQKIFDPDGDQSGMLVYSLNSSVKIAAAWAQDPLVASTAQPGLDVATLLPPLREGEGGKKSTVVVDADSDGYLSAGDTLEYDIRGVNSARASIPGPFAVTDTLPADVIYVSNSARYRFSVGGSWQAWVNIPDDGSGTAFPLDGAGFSVPGNLGVGQELQVTFLATVKNYGSLSGGKVINSGTVEISPYGLVLPVRWSDTVYGSIGDRVWQDLDGDGVQDAGEIGIAGIDVFADSNNNGTWETGEPKSTTDANGNYLLKGLVAGTYTVRVDPVDIAAANIGYGTTYDLDGIGTANVAVVTLASAQDRTDADFGYRVGASVGNRVWVDRDGDGVQENGEPGINGLRVYMDLDNDNTYDVGEPNTITSNDGIYYIGNLNAGTYVVRVDTTTLPTGANQTFDLNGALDHEASVTLVSAEHRGDLDFGYRGTLSIGDLVWNDVDANGTRVTYNVIDGRIDINNDALVDGNDDGTLGGVTLINGRLDLDGNGSIGAGDAGVFQGITVIAGVLDTDGSGTVNTSDDLSAGVADEAGLSGVRVFIDSNGNGVFDATEANATANVRGIYSITNLFNGTYTVIVDTTTLPASYVQTYDLNSPTTDHKATVTLSGASRTDVDFGYRNDATIGDLVWNDRDNDGVRDAGEPGIQGVIVYLDTDADSVFDQGVERFAITDLNGYYLIENLPSGTYSVRVEFSTLPQGSTATYDLDGVGTVHSASRTLTTSENAINVDFGYRSTASVGNFVWNDADADGIQDVGESGVNGVRVYLDINGNGAFDSATEPSSTTNSSGAWLIDGLTAGTYTARIDVSTLPAGYIQTFDLAGALDHAATFALSSNQTRTDVDFGYTQRVTIGDFVWSDANANGQQNAGETGIAGVAVTAFDASNDTIAGTTTTDSNGLYSFNLMPGTYYLVFGTPADYQRTLQDRGADATDSDISLAAGRTANVTLTGGQTNNTIDAGFYQPVAIGDFVWNDANANGQQDGGETGLDGVTVTLYRPGFGPDGIAGNADDSDAVATTTTSGGGAYGFASLPPGTYQVNFGTLAGYNRTLADNGADATDSDANAGTGLTSTFALAAGATNNTIDAGYYAPATIGDFVWDDANANGQQDGGETGLDGVTVTLYRPGFGPDGIPGNADDSDAVATTTTAGGGAYGFASLPPGTYQVNFGSLGGYNRTLADNGADATDSDADAGTGLTSTFALAAGATNNTIDAGYYEPGTVFGHLYIDVNGNGAQDSGEPDLADVNVVVTDVNGNPQVVSTDSNGDWAATVPPGATTANVDETDPQYPVGHTQTEGDDPTGVTAVSGNNVDAGNDGYFQPGSVTGSVLADTDNDNDGDISIGGVTLTLLNSVDATVATTTTAPDGSYSFANLPPGTYRVVETQPSGYLSVTDKDGGNPDEIQGIVVVAGGVNSANDFIEEEPGAIAGAVLADTDGNGSGDVEISGVTLTLLDAAGDPVDGDPNTPGTQFVTSVTDSKGNYNFNDIPPGTYGVLETQPGGYLSVSDKDGGDPDRIHPIVVPPGGTSTGNNFIEEQPATIGDFVWDDANANGQQDGGETGLDGVTVTLYRPGFGPDGIAGNADDSDAVATTTTAGGGAYSFASLPPGTYQINFGTLAGYSRTLADNGADATDSDANAGTGLTGNIVLAAGATNNTIDAGYYQPGTVFGHLYINVNGNGAQDSGEPDLADVNVVVTDVNGNPQVVSTDSNGDWAATVPPGATTANVDETDPQYPVGYTQTEGDDPTDVTAVSGNNVDAGNDGYFLSASLGDCVWMDLDKDGVQNDGPASGANGVTVELLDGSGAVIATTATADDGSGNPGFYHFGNLAPGTYSVRFTLPDGVVFAWHNGSLSATDNSDPDRTTGETAQITLSAGDNITYLDAGLKCPDTWADWKQLHPGEDATGNLDADAYGNFAEYAFAMPDGGTGSPHLDATAWIIRPSTLAPGTLEAVFVRPTGWNTGLAQGAVTYTLQYAASIGNPTVWQSVTIDLTNATVADNGDCTETVVIHDLETLTGLTGGTGVVRIEATQSDPTGPDSGATTHSEPEGWTETPLERCCQTYGTPYQRETVFTGTVGAVSGQDLAFTGQDLTGLLLPGVSYYAEVLSGDNSGQRFDVAATGDGTVTLATDADILSAAPPFNTLSTVPASLAGDIIAIRPHWTLGGLFPAAGLVASGANTTADQVQTYAAGAWTTYWLYDLGDADPATARWVKTGDPTLADAGGAVIPPGQGMFFTKRVSAAALLTYGEIRTNPFVRPLATGAQSNLVSGGYPVDQSPVGRELTTAEGFLGTKDFKTADSIFVWQNDASPPFNSGYDTYWLLNSTTPQALDRWVKQGDPTITPRDNSVLLEYDRAVFLRTAADQTGYKTAAPWTP